ncbi:MAG: hypothetical protein AB9834_16710 [Lentimicrobium sp.]
MKIKGKLFILFLLVLCRPAVAQDKGFTLLLGPAVNVLYGSPGDRFSYSPERLSWQLNGQFGFISTRGGTNRGNMLGIYAAAGSTNPEMINLVKNSGTELQGEINTGKKFNEFYTLEAGMTIMKFLRVSAGVGRQYYTYDAVLKGELNYYSGTLGLSFDLGAVNWVMDVQLMTGKDLSQNVLRASTGFMVKF